MNKNLRILNKLLTGTRIRRKIFSFSIRFNATKNEFENRNILKEKNRGLIVGIFPNKK